MELAGISEIPGRSMGEVSYIFLFSLFEYS